MIGKKRRRKGGRVKEGVRRKGRERKREKEEGRGSREGECTHYRKYIIYYYFMHACKVLAIIKVNEKS